MQFFAELRRRNVLKVAAAYALIAWILIEAGSVLLPTFGAPEWFFRVYVMLVVAGWVVSLVFAWVFEITPEGVKREREIDRSQYRPARKSGMNWAIIALLVVALGVSISFNIFGLRRGVVDGMPAAYESVAVLPFESRSTDPGNAFFADGIHDDLMTRLSNVGSLRVISRTSVLAYRDSPKNVREIGTELNVATVVQGAVQRYGDMVRITVQLVDAATDTNIWADTFDRQLTVENLFDIQSEISSEIATALRAALTPEDQLRLAAVPTRNLDAYTQYAAARQNLNLRQFETLHLARRQFEQAIALDPEFAEAHAGLAETVMVLMYNHKAIAPDEAFRVAGDAVRTALELDPRLARAHAVAGLIESNQWQLRRVGDGNRRAAQSFRTALDINPNLVDAYVWYALLLQSDDKFDEGIDLLRHALQIDPLNRIPYVNLPSLLAARGEHREAFDMLLRAMQVFPGWPTPLEFLSDHLARLGRLDEAVAWGMYARQVSGDPLAGTSTFPVLHELGHVDVIAEYLQGFPQDHPLYPVGVGYLQFLNEEYGEAVATVDRAIDDTAWPTEIAYPIIVRAAVMLGDYRLAREYLLQGYPSLAADSVVPIQRGTLDAVVMLAYLERQLGNDSVARQLLPAALETARASPRVGMRGHGITDVEILALQGRNDAALDALREAIDAGFVSLAPFQVWTIDQDPLIDGIRDEPRYEAMRLELEERLNRFRESLERARASGDWQSLRDRVQST